MSTKKTNRPSATKTAARRTAKAPATAAKAAKKSAAARRAAKPSRPPARKAAATAAKAKSGARKVAAPRSLDEFMVYALAIERDAVDRYTVFADAMETHNNREVAAMFRTMAGYEAKHAEQIKAQMGWTQDPKLPAGGLNWPGFESPETAPIDEVHYLMQPWHALQLALAAEQRAEAFFRALAKVAKVESVRKAARELQAEEAEHAALVKAWMAKVPKPDKDWSNDPDPPRYSD